MWLQIWRQSSRKGTEEVGKQWISSQGRWSTWPGVLVHFQGRLHASTFWSLLVQTSIFHFFTSLLLTMQRWSVNSGRKLLVRHCITPLTFQEVAWRNSSSFLFCSYPFLPSYTQENQSCIKKKQRKKGGFLWICHPDKLLRWQMQKERFSSSFYNLHSAYYSAQSPKLSILSHCYHTEIIT